MQQVLHDLPLTLAYIGADLVALTLLVGALYIPRHGRRDLVARFGYGLDLIAPCPPEFREAVDEQHEREVVAVLAHVSEVELASAGLDEAVLPGAGKEQNGIIGWCGHAFFLYVVLRPFDASVPDSAFQEQTVGEVIASPARGVAARGR